MELTVVADPLLNEYGSARPAILIARELAKHHNVRLISPIISHDLYRGLRRLGIQPISLNKHFIFRNSSLVLLESWFRKLWESPVPQFPDGRVEGVVLNFSNVSTSPCHFWYVQGPISRAIRSLGENLPAPYGVFSKVFGGLITRFDQQLIQRSVGHSKIVVANSAYTASLYRDFGVKVDTVIFPPIDLDVFRPVNNGGFDGDYVLTYFGKETDYPVIKAVADRGVRIKAFGSKIRNAPGWCTNHKNIEVLGWVDTQTLVRLYSNARFTIFPFLHEPFGYVPLESLACGTPVLTYRREGPSEVVTEETGWLVRDGGEMVRVAVKLWNLMGKEDDPMECRERATLFDVRRVAEDWRTLIESLPS